MTVSRMNGREIAFYYPRLILLTGEYCLICGKTPEELGVKKLEIHEIRYERPLKIANMKLLCHGCNHLEILSKENIDGREDAPAIYRVSKERHPIFLEWISGEMMKNVNQGCEFSSLVADASLYTGMRRQTIVNWLKPLFEGKTSPYILWGGVLHIRGREPRGRIEDLEKRDKEFYDKEQEEMK